MAEYEKSVRNKIVEKIKEILFYIFVVISIIITIALFLYTTVLEISLLLDYKFLLFGIAISAIIRIIIYIYKIFKGEK